MSIASTLNASDFINCFSLYINEPSAPKVTIAIFTFLPTFSNASFLSHSYNVLISFSLANNIFNFLFINFIKSVLCLSTQNGSDKLSATW